MSGSSSAKQILTPANIVTTVRIALIPVFVFVILAPWPSWIEDNAIAELLSGIKPLIAAAVFSLLALTDSVDGYLARSRNEVTTLGKFLDPLADKILVTAALLALTELGTLPAWIALVIIGREFLVSGLRMVASAEGLIIAASPLGKVKTVFQVIAIILFLLKDMAMLRQLGDMLWNVIQYFCWAVMVIAVLLTLLSLADYFFRSAAALGLPLKIGSGATAPQATPAAQVIERALASGRSIGAAESCTGGLIAAALTAVPGASEVFKGAVVSYANQVKQQGLGVSAVTLARYGAVSEETACEMAKGALRALDVDVAVSVTGIAGPGGGTPEKPVGTVWIGTACRAADGSFSARAEHRLFAGDRAAVRNQTVEAALQLLGEQLSV
ncbi:MAG: CDP-diacylglycerol--glycerol-3-phosphate 3-phosphatidyltransferase [Coriobacteriales bacterium]|jgi:CDP-diacylglycerol--glycerol-3-phosphate 3-phosphatidyltransferase|nr:CDP-diacylglycerol--glycerol-3-phosphate 3-phosphatidyltransferase [Coriobacteriales bacterium]